MLTFSFQQIKIRSYVSRLEKKTHHIETSDNQWKMKSLKKRKKTDSSLHIITKTKDIRNFKKSYVWYWFIIAGSKFKSDFDERALFKGSLSFLRFFIWVEENCFFLRITGYLSSYISIITMSHGRVSDDFPVYMWR